VPSERIGNPAFAVEGPITCRSWTFADVREEELGTNRFWEKFWSEDAGQNTVECAMLLMLITLVVIAVGSGFSAGVTKTFVSTSLVVSAAATPRSEDAAGPGKEPRLIGDSGSGSSFSPGNGPGDNSRPGAQGQGNNQGPK
jgi:Flp pilus assembly pilin Flp